MKGRDIPQADSLDRVREVVRAVADGASDGEAVGRATGLSKRHVSYYLQAARVLGFLTLGTGRFLLTDEGGRLLATTGRSVAEARVLRRAIEKSAVVKSLAPWLLDPSEPSLDKLQKAIRAVSKLAEATARRRARTLLAWRDRVLRPSTLRLPFGAADGSARAQSLSVAEPLAPGDVRAGRLAPPPSNLCFSRICAERYGPLQRVAARLGPFSVLVGSNATGKSSFMDSMAFVADCLRTEVGEALASRATRLEELLWRGEGDSFALAFELDLPATLGGAESLSRARYEVEVGRLEDRSAGVLRESLYLKPGDDDEGPCINPQQPRGWRWVIRRTPASSARFRHESGRWTSTMRVDPRQLALGALPDDRERFPVGSRVRDLLQRGVQRFVLDAAKMARPSSPLLTTHLQADGSNFARVVQGLQSRDPQAFHDWLDQLKEALPAVRSARIVEREEDKHVYLKLGLASGLELPTWRLSDGTLRIMALSLLPFAAHDDAVFLVEEPENGIHPRAIEAVFQALSSGDGTQIMVATHSPVFLGVVPPEHLLCFSLESGATRILRSDEHRVLQDWRREVDLGTLFATGVLG